MPAITADRVVRRYEGRAFAAVHDSVLREWALTIEVNGVRLLKLSCTPESLDELVLGYLRTDGLIRCAADVESIQLDGQIARVALRPAGAAAADAAAVVTDSGDYVDVPALRQIAPERVARAPVWDPQVVLANAQVLLGKSKLFRETGNVHSVMICRGPELLYFCEDVGRYNALDKCVGQALKDGTDLSDTCVYTTGRIPSGIVMKTVRAGIPMIVSRSAPTDAALAIADEYGLTVVGFARGQRFNLYSNTGQAL